MQNKSRNFSRELELKQISEDGRFSGYASVFGNVDSDGDIISEGAFTESLNRIKDRPNALPILWQHSPSEVLGTYDSLKEDERGLYVEGQLVLEVGKAKEAYHLLKAKAINALSIGFQVQEFSVDKEIGTFTITKADLWEISLVTFPANNEARIDQVKNFLGNGMLPDERTFEKSLRDVGFSQNQAKIIVASGFRALKSQREVGKEDIAELKSSLSKLQSTLGKKNGISGNTGSC